MRDTQRYIYKKFCELKMNTKILGNIGEILAKNYLKKKKFKILETNFKCKIGEIDIIASKNNIIVFVEVKFKSTKKFGLPREMVTLHKQNKIKLVASYYLQIKKLYNSICRFDVIEIFDKDINHIENAFT